MRIGPNIANVSLHKISDRRAFLERVYSQLLEDKYFGIVLDRNTEPEHYGNWAARETVVEAMRSFPPAKGMKQELEGEPEGEERMP